MRENPGPPPPHPIHSQSVEGAVKLVSQTTKHHYNWDKRHKEIISTLKSRKERPQFDSKKDYV